MIFEHLTKKSFPVALRMLDDGAEKVLAEMHQEMEKVAVSDVTDAVLSMLKLDPFERINALKAHSMLSHLTKSSERKIVIWGTLESGKSTLFKQFRIFRAEYSAEERLVYRDIIYSNILSGMKSIIAASLKLAHRFKFNSQDVRTANTHLFQ